MLYVIFILTFVTNVYSSPHMDSSDGNLYFDTYHGTQISMKELLRREKSNTTFFCVSQLKPCDPYEGRRLDGSCNNLKYPSRGAAHTPFYRLLPAYFGPAPTYEPRSSKTGGPLPPARFLRTNLLLEGKVSSRKFTQLVTHYLVFVAADCAAILDSVNYVLWKPYCCLPKGKTDEECAPNYIPKDDPVHRFSGETCLNMTKPISFQSTGCLPNDITPERINTATPVFDLSIVYGNMLQASIEKGRLFKGGLLKYEVDSLGRVWPPSTRTKANICMNNVDDEVRCHRSPEDGLNSLLGINLVGIWFWRNHNRLANELAKMNNCWNDDQVFYTARDINIATYMQILLYELLPALMGKQNLIKDGVISSSTSFRDIYNDETIPQMSLEYLSALRWFHTIQEGSAKHFSPSGHLVKEVPIVNLTLRTGYLGIGRNIDELTAGSYMQASADSDHTVDPEISERGLGQLQRTSDLTTNDVSKDRYFGYAPYIHYLEFCRGKPYNSFDDLLDVIDSHYVERLKEVYKNVADIDLLAGIWVEEHVKDGFVPQTLYCLLVEQMNRSIVSDRHWYERQERPDAFSYAQLQQIRKASVARLLCDVGDSVSSVQPRPFERIAPGNELRSCDTILSIDLTPWKVYSCDRDEASDYSSREKEKNGMRG